MMDAQYVHQRDMTTILNKIEEDLQSVANEKVDSKEKENEMRQKLNEILDSAERDIRLKTTTLVRLRLTKSNQLPVLALNQTLKNNAMKHSNKNETKIPNLSETVETHKSDAKDKTNATSVFNYSTYLSNNKSKEGLPIIRPYSTMQNSPNNEKRPQTSASLARSANSITSRTSSKLIPRPGKLKKLEITRLPRIDQHDPLADPPPLPPNTIENNGYQRLTEMRLVRESDMQHKLDDTLDVKPFKYDLPLFQYNHQEHFWLDKSQEDESLFKKNTKKGSNTQEAPSKPQPKEKEQTAPQTRPFIMFINGDPLVNSYEYIVFRRSYANIWEQLEILLKMIKNFCEKYVIARAKLDIKLMVDACQYDPDDISEEKMWNMFIGIDKTEFLKNTKISKKVGFGFIGPDAEKKAAVVIQSIWRGYSARKMLRNIRRNNAAARIIQRAFRLASERKKFVLFHQQETKRRLSIFETHQTDVTAYNTKKPHFVVHLIENGSPLEYGRLANLCQTTAALVLFFKRPIPNPVKELFRNYIPVQDRVYFQSPKSKKIPLSFTIEDILACDVNAATRVKNIIGNLPGYMIPHNISLATVEVALKLNAAVLSPSFLRISMLHTRDAIRRLLLSTKVHVLPYSSEIFDMNTLSSTITDLAMSFPEVTQWIIRGNNGSIAWINTIDMPLLETLRQNSDLLYNQPTTQSLHTARSNSSTPRVGQSDDDERSHSGEHLRELVVQGLTNDFMKIVQHTGNQDDNTFIKNAFLSGLFVESAPIMTKSSPEVAFTVDAAGNDYINGSWERLFISLYEPFAAILPAFTVPTYDLRETSKRISNDCSNKRLYGTSVITYYYSMLHDDDGFSLSLFADDISITKYYKLLPLNICEVVGRTKFNPEKMAFENGMFFYVQEKILLPQKMSFENLKLKLQSFSLPLNEKVWVFPAIFDTSCIGLVVMESSIPNLINLVLRIMRYLSENIFSLPSSSKSAMAEYTRALFFLKAQVREGNDMQTTFLNRKVVYNVEDAPVEMIFGDGADLDDGKPHPIQEILKQEEVTSIPETPNDEKAPDSIRSVTVEEPELAPITSPLAVATDNN